MTVAEVKACQREHEDGPGWLLSGVGRDGSPGRRRLSRSVTLRDEAVQWFWAWARAGQRAEQTSHETTVPEDGGQPRCRRDEAAQPWPARQRKGGSSAGNRAKQTYVKAGIDGRSQTMRMTVSRAIDPKQSSDAGEQTKSKSKSVKNSRLRPQLSRRRRKRRWASSSNQV